MVISADQYAYQGRPPVYNWHADQTGEDKVKIRVSGVIDDSWLLTRDDSRWQLYKTTDDRADTTVEMNDDTAWRLFTKNISEQEAIERISVSGNRKLGNLIAKTVSYMK